MTTFWQDARYAIRMLLKNPGFTAVAMLTLALGIGANSMIFSVVNTALFRPLPYENSDQLVMVWNTFPNKGWDHTDVLARNYIFYKDRTHVFEQIAALKGQEFNLTGFDRPERVEGAMVSTNLFQLLGRQPIKGRQFSDDEAQPGHSDVTIVAQSLWQQRFGSDPNLVGKRIILNGEGYTVIGIMPDDFQFPRRSELWIPLVIDAAASKEGDSLQVIARLKPQIAIQQARAEMDTVSRVLEQQYPETNTGWGTRLVPLREELLGSFEPALLILLGAVGFVLLIGCANVTNLQLARATSRRREIAIRLALGAGRLRLIRQLLTESLLLAFLGGASGLLLAFFGLSFVVKAIPQDAGFLLGLNNVGVDKRVLGFTFLISLLAGVISGIMPALQASDPDLNDSLKEGGREPMSGPRRTRMRGLLVISESALALVLLIGAFLMMISFMRLLKVNPGFDPANVLTVQLHLAGLEYPDANKMAPLNQQVLQRIEALPQVIAAGTVNNLPLSGSGVSISFRPQGDSAPLSEQSPSADYRIISPNYFRAMGIPLLKGREFTEQDTAGAMPVVIINETLARRFWPDSDPIGQQIWTGGTRQTSHNSVAIIGVVADIRHWRLNDKAGAQMYVPYQQNPGTEMFLAIRSTSDPNLLIPAVRNEIFAIDKDQPLGRIRTMEQVLGESIAPYRLFILLLGFFADLALVLAAVGIYGVISYSVTQRMHEMGVRVALGAQTGNILRLVIGQGMSLVLIGLGTGLVGAFALTRVLSNLLYGVSASDPAYFAGASLLLAGVALIACYIPARRATKVDPMVALRYE